MITVPKHVIFDDLGEDSVAINLLSGAYYSLNSEAAMVLETVSRGATPTNMSTVWHLLGEGLLDTSEPIEFEGYVDEGTVPFEKFTDLEALLAADPVHDVDERGWPRLQ
jgi:hypothetical protein